MSTGSGFERRVRGAVDLERILARAAVFSVYQPIVELATGRVIG